MTGRRLPDTLIGRLPAGWAAGDYWRVCVNDYGVRPAKIGDCPSNLTGGMWRVVTPLGQIGTLTKHTVREHDDDSISVRPGDGSSNSILVTDHRGEWHGYIEHGVWTPV